MYFLKSNDRPTLGVTWIMNQEKVPGLDGSIVTSSIKFMRYLRTHYDAL